MILKYDILDELWDYLGFNALRREKQTGTNVRSLL